MTPGRIDEVLEFKVITYNSMDNSYYVAVYNLKMQYKLLVNYKHSWKLSFRYLVLEKYPI